jgi:hypothetical protein
MNHLEILENKLKDRKAHLSIYGGHGFWSVTVVMGAYHGFACGPQLEVVIDAAINNYDEDGDGDLT